jgi:hypothetical protein
MSTNAHAPTVIDLNRYLSAKAEIVERALALSVAESDGPAAKLFEAMRYSLLAGGKRLRRGRRFGRRRDGFRLRDGDDSHLLTYP